MCDFCIASPFLSQSGYPSRLICPAHLGDCCCLYSYFMLCVERKCVGLPNAINHSTHHCLPGFPTHTWHWVSSLVLLRLSLSSSTPLRILLHPHVLFSATAVAEALMDGLTLMCCSALLDVFYDRCPCY